MGPLGGPRNGSVRTKYVYGWGQKAAPVLSSFFGPWIFQAFFLHRRVQGGAILGSVWWTPNRVRRFKPHVGFWHLWILGSGGSLGLHRGCIIFGSWELGKLRFTQRGGSYLDSGGLESFRFTQGFARFLIFGRLGKCSLQKYQKSARGDKVTKNLVLANNKHKKSLRPAGARLLFSINAKNFRGCEPSDHIQMLISWAMEN